MTTATEFFNKLGQGCIVGPLYSLHKCIHFAGCVAAVVCIYKITHDVRLGLAAGAFVGLVREGYKTYTAGQSCEWSSMGYDVAGLAAGYVAVTQHLV